MDIRGQYPDFYYGFSSYREASELREFKSDLYGIMDKFLCVLHCSIHAMKG
jgi:hypothetical protein